MAEEQLRRIQDKAQLLLKKHQLLQKENSRLKAELAQAREAVETSKADIDQLKQQTAILKAAGHSMNDADKKEFEKRLGTYIKEIDRCIAMLSE